MPPIEQAFVGRHERSTVKQGRRDNESIGRIGVQTSEIVRAHSDVSINRQLDRPRRQH
jgi:hypothetical protein